MGSTDLAFGLYDVTLVFLGLQSQGYDLMIFEPGAGRYSSVAKSLSPGTSVTIMMWMRLNSFSVPLMTYTTLLSLTEIQLHVDGNGSIMWRMGDSQIKYVDILLIIIIMSI